MPLYEYKCEGCGETFEVIQKFSDEPLTVHEKCGGHVHKLMSAPAFQFKGTGWYVTDYAKGNVTGPPKHESGKGESSGSDSGKSESTKGEGSKSDSGSKGDSGKKSDSGKSDGASKTSTETATKTESKSESKPASSGSSKND